MNGKLVGSFIVGTALLAGAAVWYLQTWYFYTSPDPASVEIRLTPIAGGAPEAIPVEGLSAIDATSSPIRFRACFATPLSLATLTETYRLYDRPVPLVAPGWFDCFDAGRIEEALASGAALAFLGDSGVAPGVDRVVAVFDNGEAFAWQQLRTGEEQ
ncbi:MAG: histidine kinase [Mangrovicoccus sp.]|nr:histidine kinase [Mangrovicoccus sp.]